MLFFSAPPSICITPAPPQIDLPEAYPPLPPADDDGYRATWLSVPPVANTFSWRSSPLRPVDSRPQKGLSCDQFDSLLSMSRDQRARLGKQKMPDLRKELALRNQKLKQLERRAIFLAKVRESSLAGTRSIPEVSLMSPTTANCAILPCGSEPDIEVVVDSAEDAIPVNYPVKPGWREQTERNLLAAKQSLPDSKLAPVTPVKSKRTPPSLDEITARLKPAHAHVSSEMGHSPSRLPTFLKSPRSSPGSTGDQIRPLPIRSLAVNDDKFDITFPRRPTSSLQLTASTLKLGSARTFTPRLIDAVAGSTVCTNRADTARDMMATLSRRSSPPPGVGHHGCARISIAVRMRSAPAQL